MEEGRKGGWRMEEGGRVSLRQRRIRLPLAFGLLLDYFFRNGVPVLGRHSYHVKPGGKAFGIDVILVLGPLHYCAYCIDDFDIPVF